MLHKIRKVLNKVRKNEGKQIERKIIKKFLILSNIKNNKDKF